MRKNQTMLDGPLLPSIVAYTIPIILTSVLQLLFNAADLVVVGRFCGSVSVAAVGSTGAITNLIINLFVGLSVGAGVCVAHGIGSRSDAVVHNTVHTALPTALLSGFFLTIIGVAFSGKFLQLMGAPETVLPLSTVYMRIYFGGITFTMVYNFCAAILRAAGDTRSPLIYLTFAGVINVLLNLFFVIVLDLNVVGVALATTLSQGISAVLVVWALMKRTDACRLELHNMRFYKPQLIKILRIGLPAGIQGSLFSLSNVLIQTSVNSFGDVFMSGCAAASNIEGFVYASLNSFQQTSMNYIGQNAGAGKYRRVYRTLWICLGLVIAVGVLFGSAAWYFGPQLLGIYIPNTPQAVEYGMQHLTFVCLPYFLFGMMDVSTGALRGLGASAVPMVISILGICGLRIVWIWTVFQIFHTPECLFLSYTVTWIITFICQITAFLLLGRKLLKSS